MMKRLIYWTLSLVFLLSMGATSITSAPYDSHPCDGETSGFTVGERLVYAIYYNYRFAWVPAGEVVFTTYDHNDYYKVEVTGKTYPAYNTIFEVDDYFASTIDKETGLPLTFVRKVHEGSYFKYDSLAFDQEEWKAKSFVGKTRQTVKETNLDFGSCMHDILSIVYRIRAFDMPQMAKGTVVPLSVAFDAESYDLSLKYHGIKKKKIKKLGRHRTYLFEPQVVAGEVFDENTTMRIYASQDSSLVPLLIESPISVGSVKAILRSASNSPQLTVNPSW